MPDKPEKQMKRKRNDHAEVTRSPEREAHGHHQFHRKKYPQSSIHSPAVCGDRQKRESIDHVHIHTANATQVDIDEIPVEFADEYYVINYNQHCDQYRSESIHNIVSRLRIVGAHAESFPIDRDKNCQEYCELGEKLHKDVVRYTGPPAEVVDEVAQEHSREQVQGSGKKKSSQSKYENHPAEEQTLLEPCREEGLVNKRLACPNKGEYCQPAGSVIHR